MADIAPPTEQPKPAGIAGLSRMSTTAGVAGGGDYRAVNPLAVGSAVLAVLGLAAWLHPLFLALPAVAVVLGVVGFVQVRRSNGTQIGQLLTAAGVIVALLVGGFFAYRLAADTAAEGHYGREVDVTLAEFGHRLSREDYDAALSLTSEGFRQSNDLGEFERTLAMLPRH